MKILYELFGSLLHFIYTIVGNYGVSIIIFSIIAKLILLPITLKQTKSMQSMNKLQPEIQKLQKKYGNNKEKLNEETMKLYKEHNANPLGGCLPLLIQFPIIIGLFTVLREPEAYVFVDGAFAAVDKVFLWLPDLSKYDPLRILPILAAVTTYLSMANSPSAQSSGNDQAKAMTNSMKFVSPLMIGFFAWTFPSGLALYWVMQSLLTYIQQAVTLKLTSSKEGGK